MKISKLKRGDVISVTWIDSVSKGGWYSKKEIKDFENLDCHSTGCFYGATKQSLSLYMNTYGMEFGNITQIPRKVIIKIKLLK